VTIQSNDMLAYLGMVINKHKDGSFTLTQPAYLEKMCEQFLTGTVYENSKRVYQTPLSTTEGQHNINTDPFDQKDYLRLVGSLNFMAQSTRPDILHAMSKVAQCCQSPTVNDYKRALRILLYLKSTSHLGLRFTRGKIRLICHVDAAHNCYPNGRGHYGFCFSLSFDDGVFHAVSKKIKLTTQSSTESEYVAICEAMREGVWLARLLKDIGFGLEEPFIVYEDNKSTIEQVKGHRSFQATKHINPKFHYSGEIVQSGQAVVLHKVTSEMVADILTKPLPAEAFIYLTSKLLNMN
jgi:hypothetical protein